MQLGSVTNMRTVREAPNVAAPDLGVGPVASGSRAGEDNSIHVATAFVLIGVLALAVGYLNIKVAIGKD